MNYSPVSAIQHLTAFALNLHDLAHPSLTLPYPTLPYPTLPYPTLPYPTLPYPTLPTLPHPIYRLVLQERQ